MMSMNERIFSALMFCSFAASFTECSENIKTNVDSSSMNNSVSNSSVINKFPASREKSSETENKEVSNGRNVSENEFLFEKKE